MRILVVEDDELIANVLEKTLVGQNYIVDLADDGLAGWEFVEAFVYDLIILDIVLPKLDGICFCRKLRESNYHIPVLLLTAQDSSNDKVMGLDAGADDYVVKPFDLTELLARIRVLLRRSSACIPVALNWRNLCFDPALCKVTYEGQVLSLTPKEYRLLELFLRNRHRVFSRGEILDHLWPNEQAPSEEAVTVHVKDLRQKIKRAGGPGDFIETVYGQGYRLKQQEEDIAQIEASSQVQPIPTNEQLKTELSVVWEKYKGLNQSRLEHLEKATDALLNNCLTETQCKVACQMAHKLAGALGVFGFLEGSCLAKEIEIVFKDYKIVGSLEASHLAESLGSLREILARSQEKPSLPALAYPRLQTLGMLDTSTENHPLLLIVDDNLELANRFAALAEMQSLSVEVITCLKDVLNGQYIYLSNESKIADIVILNLSFSAVEEEDLDRLAKLVNQTPPIPVLYMTARHDLTNLVKMNRLAAHMCFQTPVSPEKVLDAIMKRRSQIVSTTPKVMLVDDDETVLTGMRALLEPLGLKLITLSDPLQFLPALEKNSPDLLVLDLKMPHFSGLELCQILRSTPQWSRIAILFLTAHTDIYTTNQIFSAGANSCISKNIGRSVLATHILTSLERTRLHRSFANCVDG
ncbi:response regulator [Altericista sp. CCNU0014]|uniref:response regulator n=1 Tax=Altericista sp. CCNU0014 TaxID=3082949 RepID=UPI00384FDE36